ncbi:MAG: hypothetical protein H0V52_10545 [Acidimicrobiia bacterium]|nr:hypothetical protein [Acidimicrobiia bacterium]
MTCCGGNVVGGLLVVLVVVVVVVALLVSLVLLVVGLVKLSRGRAAKGVLVTAAAFGGIAVGLPVFLAGVSAARSDPRVLEMDLRGERPIIALDKEEFPGFRGTYQLESPRIDFELPDGRSLETKVVNTVFRAEGEEIDEFSIRGPAEDRREAARRVREWATQLDASVDGLDVDARQDDGAWSDTTRTPHLLVEVSMRPILTLEPDSGTRAIASARVQFVDDR